MSGPRRGRRKARRVVEVRGEVPCPDGLLNWEREALLGVAETLLRDLFGDAEVANGTDTKKEEDGEG